MEATTQGGRSVVTNRIQSSTARILALCLLLALGTGSDGFALAQDDGDPGVADDAQNPAQVEEDSEDAPPETEEEALQRVMQPFAETPHAPEAPVGVVEEPDACDPDYSEDEWQEDTQEFLFTVSCHSFRWFDGFFGDDVDYPEDQVNGLAILGGSWNEYEGFDSRARFRVRAPLPNWDKRWDLIFGRGDEDAFISDTQTQDETFYNPGLINRTDEDSLLLGLGGRGRDGRKGWDWSVGARLRAPPVPYVRLRWYYYKAFSPQTDLRFRQTFFWRSDDGFGVTARGDMTHAFRPQDVMRWEGVVTHSEESNGTEWYIGQTWYHLMRERRAFSVLAFAGGETDGPVALRDAGFNFIWRQPFTRDWLWISYGPSLTWPRFEIEDEREASLGFNLWLEMEFGEWRY